MVKPKQTQLAANPGNKKNSQSRHLDNLNSNIDVEDSWVMVKKQRVTILVPPLPVAKKPTMSNLGPDQLQAMAGETENQPSPPVRTCPSLLSVDEREKSISLAPRREIEVAKNESRLPVKTYPRLSSVDQRERSPSLASRRGTEIVRPAAHTLTLTRSLGQNPRMELENLNRVGTLNFHKVNGVSEASKTIKRLRLLHGSHSSISGNMLLNRRLRMSTLEKKLQQAGGLTRWLTSLGLEQFVRIFQAKSVNKFQLVNLTMKKLKDMGAHAVGPRRKLIHAIDCVCQRL